MGETCLLSRGGSWSIARWEEGRMVAEEEKEESRRAPDPFFSRSLILEVILPEAGFQLSREGFPRSIPLRKQGNKEFPGTRLLDLKVLTTCDVLMSIT